MSSYDGKSFEELETLLASETEKLERVQETIRLINKAMFDIKGASHHERVWENGKRSADAVSDSDKRARQDETEEPRDEDEEDEGLKDAVKDDELRMDMETYIRSRDGKLSSEHAAYVRRLFLDKPNLRRIDFRAWTTEYLQLPKIEYVRDEFNRIVRTEAEVKRWKDAHAKAMKKLLGEFGLSNCVFGYNGRLRRTLGHQRHATSTMPGLIELSDRLMREYAAEDIMNCCLHEIAHALVPPRNGHNELWRAVAVLIGCDGRRVSFSPGHLQSNTPKNAFQIVCAHPVASERCTIGKSQAAHKYFVEYLNRGTPMDFTHHGPYGLNVPPMTCVEHNEPIILVPNVGETTEACVKRLAMYV